MVHIYSWESLLLLHCLPAMANNASNTDSLYNDTRGLNQPGWQKLAALGEGINDHKKFRQARVHYFDDKCVVFARNCKFAHLTQYNMQYTPYISALFFQETLLMTQKAQRFQKSA